MRALAIGLMLAACGQPEVAPSARVPGAAHRAPGAEPAAGPVAAVAGATVAAPPGLRLADGVTPLAYDLTLELDPARDAFKGHVAITLAVAQPTTQIWLHAVELEIARATIAIAGRPVPVPMLAGGERWQMIGFALPRTASAGDGNLVLAIDYTGRVTDLSRPTGKEEQGLFRQRANGQWYLYSQSESVFARRIAPCFDEPRWKPAWRVTAIVPRALVALGNAPVAGERNLADGRREVRFAELAALPSYLLAVAVGPFELVELGKLGRGRLPVRLAVARGDGPRTQLAVRMLPKILDALEAYVDAPLPSAKLDLVAVPDFFGAMENTGLITFDTAVLVGGRGFLPVAAHELAHQWFGNQVTPAWWDHLWLSEAFASWLEVRVAESLSEAPAPVRAHLQRSRALTADDAADAEPLVHPIASTDDIEPAFNEIAYKKGAALLAEFERYVGADGFRTAIRRYLADHAGASVTSQAFLDALAAATTPEVAAALAGNLSHAGTPVVDLALRCGTPSAVVASARDGVAIPVCVRYPVFAGASERVCLLAGARGERPLPEKVGCPAWLVGNAGGRGYYDTAWHGSAPHAPLAALSPEERLARGDDAAAAVRRGDTPIAASLAELAALAATRDPYGELAAVAIARAIDPLIDDPVRPAWAAWLARRFASRLTGAALSTPKSTLGDLLRTQIVALTRPALDAATVAAARAAIDRTPGGLGGAVGAYDPVLLRIAAGQSAEPLFARVLHVAEGIRPEELRDRVLEALGELPAVFAPRVIDLALDGRFAVAQVWPAIAILLVRGETRVAAWRAVHARLSRLLEALPPALARDAIAATVLLCDPASRAEVADDFTPRLAAIPDGKRTLGHALASIDRCIARRAAAGDLAAALAQTPAAAPASRPLTPRR